MADGRRRVAKSLLLTLPLFLTANLEARPFRVSQIPNGSVNQCANCHINPGGGGPRNAFGQAVETGLIGGDVDWGATLAALDSDGDGFSNGQELQDPAGTWRSGQSAPGTASLVSKPGDSQSAPPPVILLSGPAATLDFGLVALGESRTLTLRVTNTGTKAAATLPITVSGHNPRELSLDGDRLSVPAGGSGALQVTYAPTLLDSVAAIVQLDFGVTLFETLVTGKGVLRPPRLVLETPSLDFGLGRVGFPDTLAFWVSNAGQEVLRISQVESGTAAFSVFPDTFEVAPSDTQELFAVYLHLEPGSVIDTLQFRSNDPTADPAFVLLAGSSAVPAISFSAASLHLDDLPFDQLPGVGDEAVDSLVITNAGLLPLRIFTIAMADSAFAVFPDSATLDAGGAIRVVVAYKPREAHLDTTALVVLSDDPVHPETRIPVFGATLGRIGPQLQVDSVLFLGPALVGGSARRALHLENRGNRNLAIQTVGIDPGVFRLGSYPPEIDPGEEDSLAVAFAPVREGEAEAILSLQSNDPLRPVVLVRLSGTGVGPLASTPGDFNGDGRVDFADFFLFADHFGSTDRLFDLEGDGKVDFADFFLFADYFSEQR